jgi:hypothetical protein
MWRWNRNESTPLADFTLSVAPVLLFTGETQDRDVVPVESFEQRV